MVYCTSFPRAQWFYPIFSLSVLKGTVLLQVSYLLLFFSSLSKGYGTSQSSQSVCISYFSVAVINCHDQKQLMEKKEFILTYGFIEDKNSL